jgi:hypothetical protein
MHFIESGARLLSEIVKERCETDMALLIQRVAKYIGEIERTQRVKSRVHVAVPVR